MYESMRTGIMLDIETLGVHPGAAVLQIGAIHFENGIETASFIQEISLDDCLQKGLLIEADTLRWWNRQDPVVRTQVFTGDGALYFTLLALNEFVENHGGATPIWCNGAGFDFPILRAAYYKLGLPPAWHYTQERDLRTLKALFPVGQLLDAPKHLAIEDCRRQLKYLNLVWEEHFQPRSQPTPTAREGAPDPRANTLYEETVTAAPVTGIGDPGISDIENAFDNLIKHINLYYGSKS